MKVNKREAMAQARRQAVLEAALEEFLAKGFAAARIEDVAARAGVAKGTVYLGFRDKAELFAEVIRAEMIPLAQALGRMIDDPETPPRRIIETVLLTMARQTLATRKGDVVRLILAETIRFPQLTQFYRDEVITPTLGKLVALLERALARGDLRAPAVVRFPQTLIAPVILSTLGRDMLPAAMTAGIEDLVKAQLDALFLP